MNNVLLTPSLPQYWESLYREDAWNLGKATPALLEFFESPLCPKSGDVLVPAAGRGFDAEAWAKRGHNVLAVDFCPSAVDALEILSNKNDNLTVLNLDLFSLSSHDEKRAGKKFDIIYDHCAFNCVHLGRRDEYIEVWLRMLKDDGLIIGFFYPLCNKNSESLLNSVTESELVARFDGLIKIEEKIVPKKSVRERAGKEEIWLLRKIL
ncbi:MAG: methyltransferase domain-containing protein [Fibromonadaceae bacterium]|jgi:SAM-dependent methyltransferase|nr:methyltransferase domain-containing protein [Fibromonadaceae bacterium]